VESVLEKQVDFGSLFAI